ncbi:hypothetical protein SGRA_3316 [Saprospira grandis str. Lewin]|uniref:Uncharacterized protein n=1 Tax=Saprospira grandis (strain Lewin) TaxID=984262 RepID=H6L107_SAPGL|nr:hypothetical protein SGRA_3316 [Saprospira grandis str. Lewin]
MVWPSATPYHPSAEALWAEMALLEGGGPAWPKRSWSIWPQ